MGLLGTLIGGAISVGKWIVGTVEKVWTAVEPHIPTITDALQTLSQDNSGAEKISRLPVYEQETATMDQTKMVDQILAQERHKNQRIISDAELGLKKAKAIIVEQFRARVAEGLKKHGINNIDETILESCFQQMEKIEPLTVLINRRFTVSDTDCLKILKIEDSNLKFQEFHQFRQNVLQEGINLYFDALAESNLLCFKIIGSEVKKRAQQIEKENEGRIASIKNFAGTHKEQKTEKKKLEAKLAELEKLRLLCNA